MNKINVKFNNERWIIECDGMEFPYYLAWQEGGLWELEQVEEHEETMLLYQASVDECIDLAKEKLAVVCMSNDNC